MLFDRFERQFTYLRISLTERCNFRCVYCMPAEGVELLPRQEILSFEEIVRVARVAAELGMHKIRLTGGEPTVRKGLPVLVEQLKALPGVDEIALTTNGALLGSLAAPLRAAGLDRVNISLDTLHRERALAMARRDVLPDVLEGIAAALKAGLAPLKLNAVVIQGSNDDELCELVEFAHRRGAQMRFIEYMPMGQARLAVNGGFVPVRRMLELLGEKYDLQPEEERRGNDPAKAYRCRRTGARVAFISSISEMFCSTCNRMRLTATGMLRPCLHQNEEVDVRTLIRSGGGDDDIRAAFAEAARRKWEGHHITAAIPLYSARDMVHIGG